MVEREGPETTATPPEGSAVEPGLRTSVVRGTKRKVSFTIDESVLEQVRTLAGGRSLSGVVNDLLARAVAQRRLEELVAEMEAEAGPAPPEAYERILSQWFGPDEG